MIVMFKVSSMSDKWAERINRFKLIKKRYHSFQTVILFLDASSHLYKRVCPSVGPSVRPSVRRSVGPYVCHAFVKNV